MGFDFYTRLVNSLERRACFWAHASGGPGDETGGTLAMSRPEVCDTWPNSSNGPLHAPIRKMRIISRIGKVSPRNTITTAQPFVEGCAADRRGDLHAIRPTRPASGFRPGPQPWRHPGQNGA